MFISFSRSRIQSWLFILCILIGGYLLTSCNSKGDTELEFERKGRVVPAFSADSAFQFIEKQLSFGPRNPGSTGHQGAKNYLYRKLASYAGDSYVYQQRFSQVGYQKDTLQLTNIIASFNPNAQDRILLCAHWDTRPRAEKADKNKEQPILGANDGGSGVAVLLELARLFYQKKPPLGVDIVLFDGEDYGKSGDRSLYFLGSRFWAQHPPVDGYQPRFGILLDMVGGENPHFFKERISLSYAPVLVNEVWNIAEQKGYKSTFINQRGAAVSDDHVIINEVLNFPVINIIDHQVGPEGRAVFPDYWHTHRDDMDIIDKSTLGAVGDVMSELIYNRL